MARRSPRVIDTKQRILAAALKLFGERGYYNVGVDEIATAAGVTKSALYYYFADTVDLARDLARQLWESLRADARETFGREQDTITNLKRGFDASFTRLRHMPEARFFLRDFHAIPGLNIDGSEERAAAIDLETAARVGAKVVFVVANNAGIAGHILQDFVFPSGSPPIARLLAADYEKMMEMVGGHAECVERPAEIRPALERALAASGPALVHVLIDPKAV